MPLDDVTGQPHAVPTVDAQATYNAMQKIIQFECAQPGGGNRCLAALATLLAEVVMGVRAQTENEDEHILQSQVRAEAMSIFSRVIAQEQERRAQAKEEEASKIVTM